MNLFDTPTHLTLTESATMLVATAITPTSRLIFQETVVSPNTRLYQVGTDLFVVIDDALYSAISSSALATTQLAYTPSPSPALLPIRRPDPRIMQPHANGDWSLRQLALV